MNYWLSQAELSRPFWDDYRDDLLRFNEKSFPGTPILNKLLPVGLKNVANHPIRFVSAARLPGVDYEKHIFRTGEVSTREKNWHDLFNALVWARFPRLKVAMNAVHFRQLGSGREGRRGMQRDALTLFDESGVIVVGSDKDFLVALAGRDWGTAFQENASAWHEEIKVFVSGHALLEKFRKPYKSLTAHALLLQLDDSFLRMPRESLLHALDKMLAELLLASMILDSPASLSPLPLMGIPGWWSARDQNDEFYADRQVFRLPQAGYRMAPIHSCGTPAGKVV
jgi:hypothetical protein